MKIAITGARGGFGPYVVRAAQSAGHSVISIDKTPPQGAISGVETATFNVDDYDKTLAAFRGCEGVIHLAAIPAAGIEADHITHNQNVAGSYNVLRAAGELGIDHVCNASSVNAIGFAYSRSPRFSYFPIDEDYPTLNEDPYALSKWICELQADSIARRYETMRIVSVRLHWIVESVTRAKEAWKEMPASKHLWAWTPARAAAKACVDCLALGGTGHDVVNLVAPETTETTPSAELAQKHFPDTELRKPLVRNISFFDTEKAQNLLKWNDLCHAESTENP
ncbi:MULTISPECIES: NAD-dependent epimerase/dehydratase family protein [Halocynthiibacter]|uniref:NAD(P)-dependent oxidoreductase n=1 Tax=Halocynthiibacter halioticoli TaxID=2986804 RepID=A0AAE3J0G7_9RHOB|nr:MULTISPECIES: NAD(P)-dependent oxidoreductase [Halocynthiibacter]MCV6822947.1 NAD(P)-dependent oxidoreductase [Halocynthiibacter halioticoli]MCW4055948.1 NAD(P)-dependent oxidoreductase [Halocynthiibacter sp. SDUM655004]